MQISELRWVDAVESLILHVTNILYASDFEELELSYEYILYAFKIPKQPPDHARYANRHTRQCTQFPNLSSKYIKGDVPAPYEDLSSHPRRHQLLVCILPLRRHVW